MPTFDSAARSVAVKLISKHAKTGVEHYWAQASDGKIYRRVGTATGVVASKALEKRYDQVGADVIYHHSHPDERALSPSDLRLISRPGVTTIWAHSPQGAAYGASVSGHRTKSAYLSKLEYLDGFRIAGAIFYPHGNPLTSDEFDHLIDLAMMVALEKRSWLDVHIQLSDTIRRDLFSNLNGYLQLVEFLCQKL